VIMALEVLDLIQPKGELEPDLFAGGRNAVQSIVLTGNPGGGTYLVAGENPNTGADFTVSGIPFNTTAAQTQALFDTAIGVGNSLVTGGPHPSTPILVEFREDFGARVVSLMTANGAGLTGGASPAATVAPVIAGATETYLRAEEYLAKAEDETDVEGAQAAFVYWRAFMAKVRQMRADAISSKIADGSSLQWTKEQIAGFEAEAAQWKAVFDILVADDAGDIADSQPTTRAVRTEFVF
jgi:hypothetical protein